MSSHLVQVVLAALLFVPAVTAEELPVRLPKEVWIDSPLVEVLVGFHCEPDDNETLTCSGFVCFQDSSSGDAPVFYTIQPGDRYFGVGYDTTPDGTHSYGNPYDGVFVQGDNGNCR